jgi:hypothetical protein
MNDDYEIINENIKHVVAYDDAAESAELFEALEQLLDHDNTLLLYELPIGDFFTVVKDVRPYPSDEDVTNYVYKYEIN